MISGRAGTLRAFEVFGFELVAAAPMRLRALSRPPARPLPLARPAWVVVSKPNRTKALSHTGVNQEVRTPLHLGPYKKLRKPS